MIDDQLHFGLVPGVHHDVGDPRDITGPQAQQVAQALAVGVHDSIKIVGMNVVDADRLGELLQQLVADHRRRDRQVLQLHGRGWRGVQVEIDSLLHERTELRLVLVVEADAFDAPAPPLHVRNGCHLFSLLVAAAGLGMFCAVGSGLVVQPADFLCDPIGEL